MNKNGNRKMENIFRVFFPFGKKGYEMVELIIIILALALLLFVIAWFAVLNNDLGTLFGKLGEWV